MSDSEYLTLPAMMERLQRTRREGVDASNSVHDTSKLVLDAARNAHQSLKQGEDWQKWIKVGLGIQECQKQPLARARVNDLQSNAYRKALSSILKAERLDTVDKSDRSVLLAMMAQLAAVIAWRSTLPRTERLRLNHPRAVMSRFKKATQVPEPKPVSDKPSARSYKAAFQGAEAEISELKQRLETQPREGGLFNLQFDQPADIARAVVANVDTLRAETIAHGILHMLRDPPKSKGGAG